MAYLGGHGDLSNSTDSERLGGWYTLQHLVTTKQQLFPTNTLEVPEWDKHGIH